MESINETASDETQTCSIRTRGGRLPDVPRLARHLEELRVGARLRGVEAVVRGRLRREAGTWWLDVTGTGETVRLAPLERTVYWDFKEKREQRIRSRERTAFSRLEKEKQAPGAVVRVTGPLVSDVEGDGYRLEVRQFDFRP